MTFLAVILIFLSKGKNAPLEDFYVWLSLKNPIGWLFRDPYKWTFLLNFVYSFLIGVLISRLFEKCHSLRIKETNIRPLVFAGLLIMLLLIPLLNAYPLLTGDLNGKMKPYKIPDDYVQLNSWVGSQNMEFKVAAYPQPPPWQFPKTTISYNFYWNYIINILLANKTNKVGTLLEPWDIKYIIVRTQMLESEAESYILSRLFRKSNEITISLKNQKDLKFSGNIGSLYIFENLAYTDFPQVTSRTLGVLGGINKFTSLLNAINLSDANHFSLLFLDEFSKCINYVPVNLFLTDENLSADLILFYSHDTDYLIKTFDATENHNPSKLWSKAVTSDPLHGEWHPYLKQKEMENWEFDYGQGLVFTWATSRLKQMYTPNNDDLKNYWTFDLTTDFALWKNYTAENQFGTLYTLIWDTNALRVELWNSTWGWKTINSPLISADYRNWYRWELEIKAENVHKMHMKIVEYNTEKKIVNTRQVKSIGSGNFDWNRVTIDFTPESPETQYIQLQVWHGHQTEQPLPNIIWIDNVKVYDLKRFVEPVTLEIPLTLQETNNYVFLARYFQNQKGGKIQVQLNNKNYILNTKDQLNRFTWKQIDTLNLTKGTHKIILTNLEGFNAVNLFAFIPKQEYQNAQNQLEKALQNKRIIYILEAETDLYHESASISNKYGGEASNGQILELNQTSKIWNQIEIVKPGNYTLAIKSKGNLTIQIDDRRYKISTPRLNWTYIGPINFEKGNHTIQITNPMKTDHLWNFENNQIQNWQINAPKTQTLTTDEYAFEGKTSLKAELNTSAWGWKTINSPLIPVTPETQYQWDFYIAAENAHSVHAKIFEYDANKTYLAAKRITGIGSGNFTWKNIRFEYTPSQNASYIQLQIWHGHETTQPLPNKIWIDNVKVYNLKKYKTSELDVIWLYSTQNSNETLEDILTSKEKPAQIISYQKIDPTKYIVEVNATKPFMLSFAEAYDPLWIAHINGKRIEPIPLYSVINGFWINQTGQLKITIEYEPQKWFYYGSIISLTTLLACLTYLTYNWTKNKAIWKRTKRIIAHVRWR
jgi:hypothetical protein